MPQRIICEKCGVVLHEGIELRPPDEVIREHDGECPKCGKKLFFNHKKVEIRVL